MRGIRWLALLGGACVALAVATVLRFARSVVTPPRRFPPEARVVGVDRARGRILLTSTAATRLPGRYGMWFGNDTGYARIGGIRWQEHGVVERELLEVVSGSLRAGAAVRDSSWFYVSPDELQVPWSHVDIESDIGSFPAWCVPGESRPTDWVIHVHGRTAQRPEVLRGVQAARTAGWQSLAISYRNDPGVPRSADHRYGLGSTEWRDVVAAVTYARQQGAKRVVLMGWSMGGLIALRTAAELQAAGHSVDGIILESAVVSWPHVFREHARLSKLPERWGLAAAALLASRLGPVLTGIEQPIDWRSLDGGNLAARAGVPILALHSAADAVVAIEPVRELAARLPELVELHEFTHAGHVRLWNQEPERWTRIVTSWLDAH